MLTPEPGFVNISAPGFHHHALDHYQARCGFNRPDGWFSPLPYFLLCRAIELELKSRHLEEKRQPEVRDAFWHSMLDAYRALPADQQILSPEELTVLEQADKIYRKKGFEYVHPYNYGTGFTRFPDLDALDAVARKLLGLEPPIGGDLDVR